MLHADIELKKITRKTKESLTNKNIGLKFNFLSQISETFK